MGGQTMHMSSSGSTDLSELALKAALQIDDLIRKKSSSTDEIASFIRSLRSRHFMPNGQDQHVKFDAANFEAFNDAVDAYYESQVKDMDELVSKYMQLLVDFEKSASAPEEEKLRNMMKFCITLHEKLESQLEPFDEDDDLVEDLRA